MGQVPERQKQSRPFKINQHKRRFRGRKLQRHRQYPGLHHLRLSGTRHACHDAMGAVFLLMNIKDKLFTVCLHANRHRQRDVRAPLPPSFPHIQFIWRPYAIAFQKRDAGGKFALGLSALLADRRHTPGKLFVSRRIYAVRFHFRFVGYIFFRVILSVLSCHFYDSAALLRQKFYFVVGKYHRETQLLFAAQKIFEHRLMFHVFIFCQHKQIQRQKCPVLILLCLHAALFQQFLKRTHQRIRALRRIRYVSRLSSLVKTVGQPSDPVKFLRLLFCIDRHDPDILIRVVQRRLHHQIFDQPYRTLPLPHDTDQITVSEITGDRDILHRLSLRHDSFRPRQQGIFLDCKSVFLPAYLKARRTLPDTDPKPHKIFVRIPAAP